MVIFHSYVIVYQRVTSQLGDLFVDHFWSEPSPSFDVGSRGQWQAADENLLVLGANTVVQVGDTRSKTVGFNLRRTGWDQQKMVNNGY